MIIEATQPKFELEQNVLVLKNKKFYHGIIEADLWCETAGFWMYMVNNNLTLEDSIFALTPEMQTALDNDLDSIQDFIQNGIKDI